MEKLTKTYADGSKVTGTKAALAEWDAAGRRLEDRHRAWRQELKQQGSTGYHSPDNGYEPGSDIIRFDHGHLDAWYYNGVFRPLQPGDRIMIGQPGDSDNFPVII